MATDAGGFKEGFYFEEEIDFFGSRRAQRASERNGRDKCNSNSH
jgi:hypothetical protein